MKAYEIKVEIQLLDGFSFGKLQEVLKCNLDKVNYKLMSCKIEKGKRSMLSYCILKESDVNFFIAIESLYSVRNSNYPLFNIEKTAKIKVIDI